MGAAGRKGFTIGLWKEPISEGAASGGGVVWGVLGRVCGLWKVLGDQLAVGRGAGRV